MANINVHEVELKLTSIKLTKSLFKQFREAGYTDIVHLLRKDRIPSENVVGWVSGSVTGNEWKKWLIIQVEEGQYVRYEAMDSTIRETKAKQIYLA